MPKAGDALVHLLRAWEWFDCMILCHFVCVRAAFAFVFVNTSEKTNNAKVIGYDILFR